MEIQVPYQVTSRLARQWDQNARSRRKPPRPPFNTEGYPHCFAQYVGQHAAKDQISVAIAAAKFRGVPMRHILITSGAPGVGKTAFAVAISYEIERKIQVLSGVITADQAMDAMIQLDDGDILVIDEIHRVVDGGKKNGEWLLHLLADGQILDGAGVHPMPAVTVIATTTDVGRLPDTITSRFPIVCQLTPYTHADAQELALLELLKWPPMAELPEQDVIDRVIDASNRNPRNMKALLASLLDAEVVKHSEGRVVPFETILGWAGLSADGLDVLSQRVLVALASEFGGTAGERPLVTRLREPGGIRHAEMLLMDKELLSLTAAGRSLTTKGWERAKELALAGVTV